MNYHEYDGFSGAPFCIQSVKQKLLLKSGEIKLIQLMQLELKYLPSPTTSVYTGSSR